MNLSLVYASSFILLTLLSAQPVRAAAPPVQPVTIEKPRTVPAAPVTTPAPATAVPAPAASVLERFRAYKGPRTPAALKALFAAPVAADTLQKPLIALSDGATTVEITISVATPDSKAPNVAVSGARLVSLKRSKANDWNIEARPDIGALNASLILLSGTGTREIPLIVAPTVSKETDLTELGFVAFLRDTVTTKQPLFDLNDDGRHDYVDDYIFTANYLARPHTAATDPVADQPVDTPPVSADEVVEQQKNPDPARDDLSQPSVSGQAFTPQGSITGQQGSTGGQTSVSQGASGSQQGSTGGQPAVSQGTSTTQTESTVGQSAYQRNLAIRNQRLRESRERLKSMGSTPTP